MSSTEAQVLEAIDRIASNVIAPAAAEVDRNGAFPRAAIEALGEAGLLGLTVDRSVGGLGQGRGSRRSSSSASRASAARPRWSSACTTRRPRCIEKHGPEAVRRDDRRRPAPRRRSRSRRRARAASSGRRSSAAKTDGGDPAQRAGRAWSPPRSTPTATSGRASRSPPRARARSGSCRATDAGPAPRRIVRRPRPARQRLGAGHRRGRRASPRRTGSARTAAGFGDHAGHGAARASTC